MCNRVDAVVVCKRHWLLICRRGDEKRQGASCTAAQLHLQESQFERADIPLVKSVGRGGAGLYRLFVSISAFHILTNWMESCRGRCTAQKLCSDLSNKKSVNIGMTKAQIHGNITSWCKNHACGSWLPCSRWKIEVQSLQILDQQDHVCFQLILSIQAHAIVCRC